MEQVLMREVQRWVAPQAAWLEVRRGALWVTRSGDRSDHVLDCGARLAVARGDDLVLQAWRRDVPAAWNWQPRDAAPGYSRRWAVPAWAWAGWAHAIRRAADGLVALARIAAARASRAQGRISADDAMPLAGAGSGSVLT